MGEMIEHGGQPASILEWAIKKDVSPENLEKLWKLKLEVEANEAKKAFHKAMAEFKANPPKITKDKKNKQYDSMYTTLGNLVNTINPELSRYGLSSSWEIEQNGVIKVTCKITHELGHSEKTSASADKDTSGAKNAIQQIKSTITYLKAVTLECLTGLASTDANLDDDGNAAGSPVISNEQLSLMRDMLVEMGDESREVEFARKFGVESLDLLPATHYKKAVEVLKMRKEKKVGKK